MRRCFTRLVGVKTPSLARSRARHVSSAAAAVELHEYAPLIEDLLRPYGAQHDAGTLVPQRVAVAVSGGADSMALALLTHEWARARGHTKVALCPFPARLSHGHCRWWVSCSTTRCARSLPAPAPDPPSPLSGLPGCRRAPQRPARSRAGSALGASPSTWRRATGEARPLGRLPPPPPPTCRTRTG
jgi:hypothetical protein